MAENDNNNPIRGSYTQDTSLDISSLVTAIAELNVNTRDTKAILNQLKSSVSDINNNTKSKSSKSNNDITYKQLEKLFNDVVTKGLSPIESEVKKSNSKSGNSNTNNDIPKNKIKNLTETMSVFDGISKSAKDLDKEVKNLEKNFKDLDVSDIKKYVNDLGTTTDSINKSIKKSDSVLNNLYKDFYKAEADLKISTRKYTDANNTLLKQQEINNKRIIELEKSKHDNELSLQQDISDATKEIIQQSQKEITDKKKQLEEKNKQIQEEINLNNKKLSYEQDAYNNIQNRINAESDKNKAYAKIMDDSAKSAKELLSIQTNLASTEKDLKISREGLSRVQKEHLPESTKTFDRYSDSIKGFFDPKSTDEFKSLISEFDSMLEKYDSAIEQVQESRKQYSDKKEHNNIKLTELGNKADVEKLNNNDLKKLLQDATDSGDVERQEIIQEQLNISNEQLEIIEEERKKLQDEQKLIDKETDLLDSKEDQLRREKEEVDKSKQYTIDTTNIQTSLLKKAVDGISKFVTKAADREFQHLQEAADKVFDSFEKMQKDIGKTLKMNSGAYDDFKQKMVDAARDAGVAVDITQLGEVAANMVEMGISDQNLIREFAVAQAKIDESGSSIKLDEETIKQMQATYFKDIRSGMSEEEASAKMNKTFEDMIAAEQWVRDNYDSTTALSSGGWEEMEKWADKLMATGDLQSEDVGKFYASMGGFMQAMENEGMDSSTILADLDSMLSGTMSELPTELQSFINSNNLGISGQEDLIKMLSSGDFGDVGSALLSHQNSLYEGMDATDAAYASKAYGSSRTWDQNRALQNSGDNAVGTFEGSKPTDEALEATKTAVMDGLKNGDYLTATEKLEKTNVDIMTDIAKNAQNIADGRYWMDQGLNTVHGILNDVVAIIISYLGSKALSSLGGGNGGDGGLGKLLKSQGAKDFLFGNKKTLAGKVGSYGTMAVGGIMSATSAVSNFKDADNFEEGLINTFRDPQFSAGLGTVIGGVVGGPIGGAIGGLVGSFAPKASEWLEDKWCSGIDDIASREEARVQKEIEAIEKAHAKLEEAAEKHMGVANQMQSDLDEQSAIFANYDDNQKENYLRNIGYSEQEIEQLKQRGEIDQAFNDAIQSWVDAQKKQIEDEKIAARADDLISKSVAEVIGVDNAENWKAKDYSKDELQKYAEHFGIDGWEKMDKDQLASAITSEWEDVANKQGIRNESGQQLMSDIETWAINSGRDDVGVTKNEDGSYSVDMEKASQVFLSEHNDNDYTEAQIKDTASQIAQSDADKKAYNEANDEFHERINKILEEDPSIDDYETLFRKYEEKYPNFFRTAVQDFASKPAAETTVDTVSGKEKISENGGNLPNLKWDSEIKKDGWDYPFNPKYYLNEDGTTKYRSGLDFVPWDDFPALLHKGEMILTQTEADNYRKKSSNVMDTLISIGNIVGETVNTPILGNNNSSGSSSILDTSSITDSVNSQTDRIEKLLLKILQILTYKNSSSISKLPKSLLYMNSDLSVM